MFTINWHDAAPFHLELRSKMYLATPDSLRIEGGCGIVVSRLGYHGALQVGGPIEPEGRLRYIDGCTDSLLIPPLIKGDPCLNHLHFPTGISQSRHTHPSMRVGVVVSGSGRCVVPDESQADRDVTIPLEPGNLFYIPTNGQHSFFTDSEAMDVIAYHPDSDTGPDHDDHPMVNCTMVNGVSASQIAGIRTR
jgi:mannose-6-phosphate isomerase-like protein (cupin superfamily)